MLIQLTHLPSNFTNDDVEALMEHMKTINCIHVAKHIDKNHDEIAAWVDLNCSRVGVNAICHCLNGKYIGGHHIMAYPSLYSH